MMSPLFSMPEQTKARTRTATAFDGDDGGFLNHGFSPIYNNQDLEIL